MKKLLGALIVLAFVALPMLADDKFQHNDTGNLYEPTGQPNGGNYEVKSSGNTVIVDPDGYGPLSGMTFYWNEACGCYQSSDGGVRFCITCSGTDLEGHCICWDYEIWMQANNPPHGWQKVDEGLAY